VEQTLLDPAVKVPGIIAWPGVIPAGLCSRHVAGPVDVCATLVEATDGPALPRAVGRSLLPALSGGSWEDLTIAEHCADRNQAAGLGLIEVPEPHYQRMVRRGQLKYIDHGHEPAQLFDLDADPDETVNRSGDPVLAQQEAKLRAISRTGWDPETVREQTRASIAEHQVIKEWARQTRPPDRYRWRMRPVYNELHEPESDLTVRPES
jgi:arylsulfatase A-like enzyme